MNPQFINGMQARENMLSYLLQALDANGRVIEDYQKQIAELNKKVADLEAKVPKE